MAKVAFPRTRTYYSRFPFFSILVICATLYMLMPHPSGKPKHDTSVVQNHDYNEVEVTKEPLSQSFVGTLTFSVVLAIGLLILRPVLAVYIDNYSVRLRKSRTGSQKSERNNLECLEVMVPTLLPSSWERLKDAFDGLSIAVPDKRTAVWQTASVREFDRQLSATMWYTPNMIARRGCDVYCRQVNVVAMAEGVGCKTRLSFKFQFQSPMDNVAKSDFIRKTVEQVVEFVSAPDSPDRAASQPEYKLGSVPIDLAQEIGLFDGEHVEECPDFALNRLRIRPI